MLDWLVVWGVGQASWSVFRPILEDLAKDVAEDAAKSYVGQCFKSVYSVIRREPLTRATGLALKELLELVEDELIRADIESDALREWVGDVGRFTKQDDVRQAIASLFLEPDYHLDPKTFASAWQQLEGAHTLPDDFSWPYVAKRFASKVAHIRESSPQLRETFASLAAVQDSTALQEIAGLPPDFDLETYREALVERYGHLDFASLDMTGAYYSDVGLWSVFVPQSVRECHEYDPQLLEVPKDQLLRLAEKGELDAEQLAESEKLHEERRQAYVNQSPRPVLDVADDAAIERVVVLGDPGSGKSSLLRFLALRWARIEDANLRFTQPLPLLIELREYNRWECSSGKGFPKYLHEASTWHRLNQQTLKHLLEQPDRVVLLLDGLDEVFDPAQREQVVNDIHRFSNDYKQVRIVVTSRVVGYQPHRLRSAEFRHFMLQDLDKDQIGSFLDKWHDVTFADQDEAETKRERLQRAIENSKSIAQLAGNPLLLTMMAILNRNQKLPDDRVDLYQQCSRLLLYQWDVERQLKGFPGLSDEIGLREKTDILRSVANAMQTRLADKSRANYIDGSTLTSLIEDYLHEELRFDQARAVARALVEQLRTRNFILCSLGADSYAFVHRTFLEYFCAADIVHQFNVAKTLSEEGLIALFDDHCRDDDWREVLRLVGGQIDQTFLGTIVEHLISRTDLDQWDGKTPLPELPVAIACLSETRAISQFEPLVHSLYDTMLTLGSPRLYHPELMNFLEDVLRAAREIVWPSREYLQERIMLKIPELDGPTCGQSFFAKLFVVVSDGQEELHGLIDCTLGSSAHVVRGAALEALAAKWPDETTRALLTRRGVQDDNDRPRVAAITALAEKWPDEKTRELLTQRAVQDDNGLPRRYALNTLAENWPDETTRELLTQRAVQDDDYNPRRAALAALAENWPDETTRELLTQRAVQDDHYNARSAALAALAENWPDETTRALLTQRAVDDNEYARSAALKVLAENWPDEMTRALLTQRAVEDDNGLPRRYALKALVENWPDEATRALLTQRAIEDDNEYARPAALEMLAENWPDETTRELLTQRAIQDEDEHTRRAALQLLMENWPDETTRALLTQRAVQDDNEYPRRAALEMLAENWPDETTRELLTQRAVQDDHYNPRSAALAALAENWPHETTRALLTQRAVEDDNGLPRRYALKALVENWPDEATRALLTQRGVEDDNEYPRRAALGLLAEKWPDETTRELLAQRAVDPSLTEAKRHEHGVALGRLHSKFGRIVMATDRDGIERYLDPREPISREQIERAAKKADIPADKIDETVRSLSEHLGWDITRGQ